MITSHPYLSAGADICEGSRQVKPAVPAGAEADTQAVPVAGGTRVRGCARA